MDDLTALKQVPLFNHMSDEDLHDILTLMAAEDFAPGAVIIREGEPGEDFFVIVQGQVRIAVRAADGNELVVGEAGPGGFFGELSMLTGELRSARVQTVERTRTLKLNRDSFLSFLEKHPQAAIAVLMELGHRLHKTDSLLRQSVSRNVNELAEQRLTFGQRIADSIANRMGSWAFIIIQTCLLIVWIILNCLAWIKRWDPYPFILLNLMLSFQSAYAAPIIMMSQNRQTETDRLAAEVDHQVNTKAEIEIGLLLQRVDELETVVRHHADEQKQLLAGLAAPALPAPPPASPLPVSPLPVSPPAPAPADAQRAVPGAAHLFAAFAGGIIISFLHERFASHSARDAARGRHGARARLEEHH